MTIDTGRIKKQIGRRIARARKARNITQEKLAERLEVNLVTISRLERGHSIPGVLFLFRVCETLGLPTGELFDVTPTEKSKDRVLREVFSHLEKMTDDDFRLIQKLILRITSH